MAGIGPAPAVVRGQELMAMGEQAANPGRALRRALQNLPGHRTARPAYDRIFHARGWLRIRQVADDKRPKLRPARRPRAN